MPIFLDVDNQHVLIVGGGQVAKRKVSTLLSYNVHITVVSTEISPDLEKLATRHTDKISIFKEKFTKNHLKKKPFKLVFATTDDDKLNQEISKRAKELGILANVATSLTGNHFIMPAIIQEGDFQIAISTSGNSPLLAKMVKQSLMINFLPQLCTYTKVLGEIRAYIQDHCKDNYPLRQKIYNKVLNSPKLLTDISSGNISLNEALQSIIQELK